MGTTIIRSLHTSLKQAGFTSTISSDTIVADFGIQVHGEITDYTQHPSAHVVGLFIQAIHPSHFPEGINDVAVGIATTKEAAIQDAATIWVDGTYSVIRESLNPNGENPQVRRLDMACKDLETGQLTSWVIYRGPVQASGILLTKLNNSKREEMNSEIMRALLDEITGVLVESRLMWLKCSISRQPDGKVQGDCWLNNQNWLNGLNQLYWLTETWPQYDTLQRRRQFFIFKPVERSTAENEALLAKAMPSKKWWQVWR